MSNTTVTVQNEIHSLKHSIEQILQLLQTLMADREDDSILLQAVASQMQVQGQRLRQVESHVKDNAPFLTHVKDQGHLSEKHIIDSLNIFKAELRDEIACEFNKKSLHICNEVRQISETNKNIKIEILDSIKSNCLNTQVKIREDLIKLDEKMDYNHNELSQQMHQISQSVPSGSIDEVKQMLKHQSDKIVQLESSSIHVGDKVDRWTSITALTNTKLREGVEQFNATMTDTKQIQDSKIDGIQSSIDEVKKLSDEIKEEFDVNGRVSRRVRENSRATIDQIIAESQIIREIIQNSRKIRTSYICDFRVRALSKWKGSEDKQFSNLWYIDQFGSHIKGYARFQIDKLVVSLIDGQYPRMFGLSTDTDIVRYKLTVKVMKQDGGTDVCTLYKDEDCYFDPTDIDVKCDGWSNFWGFVCGSVSYKHLEEFIWEDTVLLRFKIGIL